MSTTLGPFLGNCLWVSFWVPRESLPSLIFGPKSHGWPSPLSLGPGLDFFRSTYFQRPESRCWQEDSSVLWLWQQPPRGTFPGPSDHGHWVGVGPRLPRVTACLHSWLGVWTLGVGALLGSPIPYVLRLHYSRVMVRFSAIPGENGSCSGKRCFWVMELCLKRRRFPASRASHRPPQSHHRNGLPRAWGIFIPQGTYGLRSLKATQIEEGGAMYPPGQFWSSVYFEGTGQGRKY